MFGYVLIAPDGLSEESRARYRACYCGLCHSLRERYGSLRGVVLSYDFVFLAILLQSMYEAKEEEHRAICPPHPFRKHSYFSSGIIDYCADMNLLLAYHKALDDCADDRDLKGKAEKGLLEKSYQSLKEKYPETCKNVDRILKGFEEAEKKNPPSLDELLNLSGELLGAVYAYRKDEWTPVIQSIGRGLGRFIYLMDAWEDLPADLRRHRFNPLGDMREDPDYENFIKQSLTLLIAEATENAELLPLVEDTEIIRNVLYAGCWNKYETIRTRRNKTIPAEKAQGGNP